MQATQSNTALVQESCSIKFAALRHVTRQMSFNGPAIPTVRKTAAAQIADSASVMGVAEGAGLAHDAGNLLGALSLYSDLLALPGVLHEEHKEYASELRMLSDRSWAMIDRLVNHARAGRPVKAQGDISVLPDVVERCQGLLSRVAGRPVEISYGVGAFRSVRVPVESVERILTNLVKNAAEATPWVGTISIHVEGVMESSEADAEEPRCKVVMTVTDRGCGMDQTAVRRLMQRDGISTGGRGGLGFRVVRELVAISNGYLKVKSQPEVGTSISAGWHAVKGTMLPAEDLTGVEGEWRRAKGRGWRDRVLRVAGLGAADAQVSGVGEVPMLSDRMKTETEKNEGVPSGVLVGVSPVGMASATEQTGSAEHFGLLHVLVVDDDDAVRKACCQIALGMGFEVIGAESATAARAILKQRQIDLLLLDLKLPGGGGLPLLEQVKALHPDVAVIVMTAFATVSSAVEAMRIGAGDYLTKPFALEELTAVLERTGQQLHMDVQSRQLRERLRTQQGMGGLVGRSPEMEKLYRILSKVAYSTHPVLILGESGTGKELVARSIHFNGPNAAKPFVPVDCGSLVPTLIESELFGHVKGAFTGADRAKEGLLASAEGGTVFLDEVGELPLDLQAKLLRALQEKEVRPVGATQAKPISARVLAATNRDLASMVEQGRFRKDLYFRLNVVNLRIPPLRDRREDIAVLATHFLEQMEKESGVVRTFSDTTLRVMAEYDWPGNVRELENAIERACALSSGPVLHMGDLPTQLQNFRLQKGATARAGEEDGLDRSERMGVAQDDAVLSIAEMEKRAILGTIRQLKGDKLMAAKLLGIGKTTLYRKLKEYGITEGLGD